MSDADHHAHQQQNVVWPSRARLTKGLRGASLLPRYRSLALRQ
jgi:hypothetical protein